MVRRFGPSVPRDQPGRWEEDDEESRRGGREPFEREVQFARSSGDSRWGTGGMPVDEYPRRPPFALPRASEPTSGSLAAATVSP